MDMIIAMAQNENSLVSAVMTLYDVDPKQHSLLEHLINLYDMKDSELSKSSEKIEKYIKKNPDVTVPPGLIQAIYGSIRKFSDVLAHGVARNLPDSGIDMIEDAPDPKIMEDLPQIIVWIAER